MKIHSRQETEEMPKLTDRAERDRIVTAQPKTVNRRLDIAAEGGLLAERGFYTRQVQAVVRKWEGKITAGVLEENFADIAAAVMDGRHYNPVIEFRGIICRTDWTPLFELGMAISKVVRDDKSINKWAAQIFFL